jgi:hypothetical protein
MPWSSTPRPLPLGGRRGPCTTGISTATTCARQARLITGCQPFHSTACPPGPLLPATARLGAPIPGQPARPCPPASPAQPDPRRPAQPGPAQPRPRPRLHPSRPTSTSPPCRPGCLTVPRPLCPAGLGNRLAPPHPPRATPDPPRFAPPIHQAVLAACLLLYASVAPGSRAPCRAPCLRCAAPLRRTAPPRCVAPHSGARRLRHALPRRVSAALPGAAAPDRPPSTLLAAASPRRTLALREGRAAAHDGRRRS